MVVVVTADIVAALGLTHACHLGITLVNICACAVNASVRATDSFGELNFVACCLFGLVQTGVVSKGVRRIPQKISVVVPASFKGTASVAGSLAKAVAALSIAAQIVSMANFFNIILIKSFQAVLVRVI